MTVEHLLKYNLTGVKEVATLLRKSKDPLELAKEIASLEIFRELKLSDKRFLEKHMFEAIVRENLSALNYCVCNNPKESLKLIREDYENQSS